MPESDIKINQDFNSINFQLKFSLVQVPTPKQVYQIDIGILFWSIIIVINAKLHIE